MDSVVMEYCNSLITISKELPFYTPQLFRYLLSITFVERIQDIIVVERPYRSDIHPEFFAAMSYDPQKSDPTPSTLSLASVLSQEDGPNDQVIENWFRDGWKKLADGVVLLNVCYAGEVGDTRYHREVILFQEFLRAMLVTIVRRGETGITVYAIGNKPIYVVSRTLSSLGSGRSAVTLKKLDSPITLLHKRGDGMSRRYTRENKDTIRSLSALVLRTTTTDEASLVGLFDIMEESKKAVVNESLKLADELNKVRSLLKDPVAVQSSTVDDVLGDIVGNLREFSSRLTRLNMSVLLSPRQADQGVARPSLFGNKRPPTRYPKSTASYADSEVTTPSNVSSSSRIMLRGFDDDDDDEPKPQKPQASRSTASSSSRIMIPKFDDSDDSTQGAPTPVQKAPLIEDVSPDRIIPPEHHEVLATIYDIGVIKDNEWVRDQLSEGIFGKKVPARVADMIDLADKHYRNDDQSFRMAMGVSDSTYKDVTHPVYKAILNIKKSD